MQMQRIDRVLSTLRTENKRLGLWEFHEELVSNREVKDEKTVLEKTVSHLLEAS